LKDPKESGVFINPELILTEFAAPLTSNKEDK